jgi:hypothetical protein
MGGRCDDRFDVAAPWRLGIGWQPSRECQRPMVSQRLHHGARLALQAGVMAELGLTVPNRHRPAHAWRMPGAPRTPSNKLHAARRLWLATSDRRLTPARPGTRESANVTTRFGMGATRHRQTDANSPATASVRRMSLASEATRPE